MTTEKLTIKIKTVEVGKEAGNKLYRTEAEILLGGRATGLLIQNLVFALSAESMVPLIVMTATPQQFDFEFDGEAEVLKGMSKIKEQAFNIRGTPFCPIFAPLPPTRIPKSEFTGDLFAGKTMTAEEIKKFWEGGTGLKADGPEVAQAVEDLKKRTSHGEELPGG